MNTQSLTNRRSTIAAGIATLALIAGPALTGTSVAAPASGAPAGFGHSAYRGVALGMTAKALRGTGAGVGKFVTGSPCTSFVYQGGSYRGDTVDGYVQRRLGVVAMWAKKDAVTAKGIKLGSSRRAFVAAYGQIKPDVHGYRHVKIGKHRYLGFGLANRQVREMWAYDDRQRCYN